LLKSDKEESEGWVDARNVVEYKQEVTEGELVKILIGVIKLGTKSITLYEEMRNALSGELHATMEAVLVRFDLNNRSAIAISIEQRQQAQVYLIGEG